MSGGHYDYACFDLNRIVEKLEEEKGLSKESEKCRKKLVSIIKKVAKLVYELEWFDSGDTGNEELNELVRKLEKVKI